MKKRYFLTIVAIFSFLGMSHAQILTGAKAKEYVKDAESVVIKSDDYLPSYIKFTQGEEPDLNRLSGWIGENFKLSPGFGLKYIKSETDQLGYTHYRYQQTINGYPVVGGDYIAHVRYGKVVSVNGSIRKYVEPNTQISITESSALQYALNNVNASKYKWELPDEEKLLKYTTGNTDATYYPKGELTIVPLNGDYASSEFRLAYKFDIYSHEPLSRQYLYIDAITGAVVMKTERIHTTDVNGTAVTRYSGNQTITADSYSGYYRLREAGRGLGVETYDMNQGTNYGSAVDFTDADNYWNNVNAQQDEVATDAHWGTEMTYDYYYDTFGRNSLDDAGMKLLSYVHYSSAYNNAFWDGTRMTYGDGDGSTFTPFTALDVCGHECTHGVDEHTANLTYQDESGALNEGFSDIFGTCIEFYAIPASANWTMGEDIGMILRDLSNPNAYSLPDTYLGTYWYTGTGDYGGVHTNCGVLGYWFYLLSQGGSGTNDIGNSYNVTGITKDKAAQIAYRTLTYYLSASSVYADARTYSILACQDLYGGCSQEAISNQNAWYAVGIGAAYSPTPTTADFTACPTATCNNAPFTVQFTNLSTNANTFMWYFGDGGTSTSANPSHVYSTNGSYNVKLVADGGTCGIDSVTKSNYIQVGPSYPCTVSLPTSGTGTTQTSCTGTLYDSGICGDYTDNTDGTMTISPTSATSVTITFSSFNFESGYDYLYIYDGPSTASPQFTGSPFTGTSIPGPFTSSGGSVTIRQTSDAGVVASGFVMSWVCVSPSSPPIADFSADVTSSCTGIINFTDLSTNAPTSWLWNFGDGQTSNSQDPSHTYTASGTYTVTLTATNAYGSDQEIKIDYITISLPTAPTTTGASRCGTGSVTLTASGGSGTLVWYDAPTGGNIVNTGTSFVTPSLSSTTTYYVEDSIPGTSQYVGKADNSGGGGYVTGTTNYLIFDCYSPVTLVSVVVYPNGSAARTIELRNSSGVILQSSTQTISTSPQTVTLNFSIPVGTDLQLGCTGATINLYRNTGGITFPYTAAGLISIKDGSTTGRYYYYYNWLIQEPSCISARTPVTATINPNVTASVSIAANPSGAICSGTSVVFTATPTNGGTTPTYQWQLNGSPISGATNSTYTSSTLANGNIITCVMTSNATCVTGSPATSNSITMTVNSPVTASVSIAASPSGAICSGTSVTFTATPTNGGTTPTYQWQLNGSNISGATNSTYTSSTLANGNTIKCIMTSSLTCVTGSPATSNTITMTVNSPVTASVSIAASPSGAICSGTSVTFTATPTNGGVPTYQWKLNGSNIAGATNSTYTSSTLANGDLITCVMTSSLTCVTGSPATSNTITMTVNSLLPASVSISANPSGAICAGTSVVFTATPTNGGSPTYQWQNNGSNIAGATNSTYTSSTLTNGNIITCIMTSSLACASGSPATSNAITMTVNSPVTASVSISANPSGAICSGTSVTFTATATNGGATPSYQWKKNGFSIAGATNSTYTSTTFANGDLITCVMTSSLTCVTGSPATSNTITMSVNFPVPASVSIAASPSGAICSGTSVTFTATATNGGTTPAYQWQNNGSNIAGATNSTYTSSTLANGNIITCIMTSSLTCVSGSPATSNSITMSVTTTLPASVSITANPSGAICIGTSVTFTATATNGGTPTYQWKLNGSNITGATNSTYTSSTLTNGDIITCVMTSSLTCVSGSPATSNTLTMIVGPPLAVSVNISANPGGAICSGTSVTLTATPTNGGATPTYQWQLNGSNISGATNSTYTTSSLANSDVITCILTSSLTCATGSPATSNSLTMTVSSSLVVSVSIAASPSGAICAGTSVTFTATPTNGGPTPSYQWKNNGTNITGATNSTYTSSTLANGNIITCVMTSSLTTCITGSPATSNAITMTVNPADEADVTIAASPSGSICSGTSVTFTATPLFGGSSPAYQWQLNGTDIPGETNYTYTSNTLANGDIVTCTMTSNLTCVTGSPATSNPIVMAVNSILTASISISASPGNQVCTGSSVTFTATPMNGGVPTFQWQLNGSDISGETNSIYTSSTLASNDSITCIMNSSLACATGSPATSDTIIMTVGATGTAFVAITASPSGTICTGTSVTFTANATNGGSSPAYQWQLNGSDISGETNSTYTSSTLADTDVITCIMTGSDPCMSGSPATSNAIPITVSSFVAASVSISASPSDTICAGENVIFTAIVTNGGIPTYQWQLNGSGVGPNSSTISSSALNDGDIINCIVTSSLSCATGNPATSNSITMVVSVPVTASINIFAAPSNTICAGQNVVFTAVGVNGGTSPTYQWQLNGSNVGPNSTTINSAALSNGDVITCIMTSSAACVSGSPATSNAITMSVSPYVAAGVSISANPGNSICSGTNVIFTATPTNGGTAPTYQWQINSSNIIGATNSTYSSSTIANGDVVTCIMTSNALCVTGSTVTSNTITMTVQQNVTASVIISANPGNTICEGTNVSFTAAPTNGGTPTYQWLLNGSNIAGATSSNYTTATLINGDIISCMMTSSLQCASGSPAISNYITMSVTTNLPVSVNIASDIGDTICSGDYVTYTATPTNGGTSPSCQWQSNGSDIPGATNSSYITGSLSDGDVITCVMISSITCVTGSPATSNSIAMTVFPTALAGFTYQNFSNDGTILFYNTSQNATSYIWYFGDGDTYYGEDTLHRYLTNNSFSVTLIATNSNNCSDTITIDIILDFFHGLYIPNAFSPTNTNSLVKYFQPVGIGLETYTIQIYDTWGNIIWESSALDADGRPTEYWDGNTKDGTPLPMDTYIWKAGATFKDGGNWPGMEYGDGLLRNYGTVTIIK